MTMEERALEIAPLLDKPLTTVKVLRLRPAD